MTWRLIEQELTDILRSEGFSIAQTPGADRVLETSYDADADVNLTTLAQELARRGIGKT